MMDESANEIQIFTSIKCLVPMKEPIVAEPPIASHFMAMMKKFFRLSSNNSLELMVSPGQLSPGKLKIL